MSEKKNYFVDLCIFWLLQLQIIEKDPFVCLVEEFAEKGDLLRRIRQTGRVDESESKFFYRQIMEALVVRENSLFFFKSNEKSCGRNAD